MIEDFATFLRRFEEANTAFVNGDPSLWMPLVSHSEQSSIFGGFGGQEIGWSQIGPRYEWASEQFRELGAKVEFEYLVKHVGADTAYTVAIERCTVQHRTQPEPVPHLLRATMIFRLEAGTWKITHRHADPLNPKSAPSGP
ncbi:nuclear transport factor 2 family protein [Kribbella solani]|uniref:YybH family protein n=1 Tax=Kribbella solani TaxID=236067 RepID=UPI0029B7DA92|nr:nuclear transport factor 2 family protein [Kribbella solani]MDX3000200.1 nuclear transport factor 2 family protein [Kribbella solani]